MDTVVAMLVVVQRQLLWFRRQKTAQVPQFQYFFVVDVLLCRWTSGFVQFLDKVVDMPVIVNDRVAVHSGGASDSVHRLFMWTFQLCNRFRRDSQVQFLVFLAFS